MAVVQISRIQVRRGKANSGTGIPQLASGEIAWALDTQQLYIGNGSVAEGAPAVGNTKILTENDLTAQGNILSLIKHIYKAGDPTMQTGPSAAYPVSRDLQDRLDDRVSFADFVLPENYKLAGYDYTVDLQRAINQLYLNPTTKASADTDDGKTARVILDIPAGKFSITETIYIPSYATLVGAGADKTVIEFTGTGPVFQFVNDTSEIDAPDSINNTLYTTQPRFIKMAGLSVITNTADQPGLQLNAVRDSVFENIIIEGVWEGVYNAASKGIAMNVVSSLVTCERNIFKNVTIKGFSYAVYAKQDILNNAFKDCYVTDCRQGFILGEGANGSSVGEQYGPRETQISNCRFDDVKRQAVFVDLGKNNTVVDAKMSNVGNNGGGHVSAEYPQVYFKHAGNSAKNVYSDRSGVLSVPTAELIAVPYVPEVAGFVTYTSFSSQQISIGQITNAALCFRLPASTDQYGDPSRSIGYKIDYVYRSVNNNFTRQGTLTIGASVDPGVAQLTDEYNFSGPDESLTLNLDFTVVLLAQDGTDYVGDLGQVPSSVAVKYTNSLVGDVGTLEYTYTSVS